MLKKISFVVLLFVCFAFNSGEPLMEKFRDAIADAYETEIFVLKEIMVPAKTAEKLSVEVNQKNLFEIKSEGKLLGYAYLGEAPSKKRMFDYAVFFTPDFIIKKSKVLIYREDFGRQIGTRRWLSQFKGMSSENRPKFEENISGISGATISASSMTRAVNNVLQSISVLQEKNIL